MKAGLSKKVSQHTGLGLILILKLSLIGLLFPIKTIAAAPLVVFGAKITWDLFIGFCAGATLLITVYDRAKGDFFYVEPTRWRYERNIGTNYKGVRIEQCWIQEQLNVGGSMKYRYTCKSESFTDKNSYEHRNEFSISEWGSMGDVPLEVRDSMCSYWMEDDYSEPNLMTQKLFTYSNRTQFSVRCKLSWTTPQWITPTAKRVNLKLLDWTPELNSCEEASRYRSASASFPGEIPANGWGNITVKSYWLNNSMIQLSCGPGAGMAVE